MRGAYLVAAWVVALAFMAAPFLLDRDALDACQQRHSFDTCAYALR